MDGAFYALGPLVAFCTVLFLIAEPMRNTGKYTLGDMIRSRMQTRTPSKNTPPNICCPAII